VNPALWSVGNNPEYWYEKGTPGEMKSMKKRLGKEENNAGKEGRGGEEGIKGLEGKKQPGIGN